MTGALMTPENYLRDLEREAERLPRDERQELIEGMRARLEELSTQGLDESELAKALAALGDPRQVIDDYLAVVGEPPKPRYRSRLVVIALICAWLIAATSVPFNPNLGLPMFVFLVVVMVGGVINSAGSLALLVLSIVGGMWRRWWDGLTTLFLLLVVPSSQAFVVLSGSAPRHAPELWIGRVGLALDVAILVLATGHWARRLLMQATGVKLTTRGRRRVLAAALGPAVAILAMTVLLRIPDWTAPTFATVVVNDTGGTVSVTYCPHQNCHGQPPLALSPGDRMSLHPKSGRMPDSIVVESPGKPTTCALLPDFMMSATGGEILGGSPVVTLSTWADAETCGNDVASLDHPEQSG